MRRVGINRSLAVASGLLLFLTPGFANGVFSGYTDTIINLLLLILMRILSTLFLTRCYILHKMNMPPAGPWFIL